jgi:alanyl-tRNA synthetase
LCGGTHVPFTGQIGLFRIVAEGAVAAGIRRIEAVTGAEAEAFMYEKEHQLEKAGELLKNPKDLARGIEFLLEENQRMKKAAGEFEKLKTARLQEVLRDQVKQFEGARFLGARVELSLDELKSLAHELRNEFTDLFLLLASESDGKANLVLAISDDLIRQKNLHAGKLIRELAKDIDGGGGGQPHIATAGGKNPSGIPQVIAHAESMILNFQSVDSGDKRSR